MPTSATERAKAMLTAYNAGDMDAVIALAEPVDDDSETGEIMQVLLGSALQATGRLNEAVATFDRLVNSRPNVSMHWNNLAVAQRQRGDAQASEQAFFKAQSLAPDDAEVHYNLGLLYVQQRRWVDARDVLLDAVRLAPGFIDARLQAAYACYVCGDNTSQEAMLEGAVEWPPQPAEQALTLAAMLSAQGNTDAAMVTLARAELSGYAETENMRLRIIARRIALYERSNQLALAQAELEKLPLAALDQLPAQARLTRSDVLAAHAAIAMRNRAYADAADLYRQMSAVAIDNESRAVAGFGLANACDKQGRAKEAWQAADMAHAAQLNIAREVVPELLVEGSQPLQMASRVVDAATYRTWSSVSSPPAEKSPVFVVGFPRSGTTLLEQMIDSHTDFRSMDERAFIHELTERMEAVGQRYPADLANLTQTETDHLRAVYFRLVANVLPDLGAHRLVDKNPLNMLGLPMIMRLFPNARIILCLRHPCDVLLSCTMQSFRSPAFMVLCSSLEFLARGYVHAFEQWFKHIDVFKPRVLEWRYESVVEHFDEQVVRLGQFLEVDDASAMTQFAQHAQRKRFISTPSYAQVTQGINRGAMNRWHAYREAFDTVMPLLQPMMERLGYGDAR